MYAVDPAQVRENAEKLTEGEILDRLLSLVDRVGNGMWVTFSGGNPALMDFGGKAAWELFDVPEIPNVVGLLHRFGFKLAVETQGSRWRDWLVFADHLTVSPKPPSSGMVSQRHAVQTANFLWYAEQMPREKRSMKVVVFDDDDYAWAQMMFRAYPAWDQFLSVGTDQDALQDEWRLLGGITERYAWLCEKVAHDPVMRGVRVIPQLHVLAWGVKRGV